MNAAANSNSMVPGYQLLNCLGEGAAGVVYQARQQSTGQLVALKLLRTAGLPLGAAREKFEARFARETKLCAQLHHPHIVRLLDKGQTGAGELYAVFEFVPGETLRDLIIRQGPLPAALAGDLMLQVLDALATAHAQGIVHRDLKPMNIMASRSGARLHAKVLDFGIGTIASALDQLGVRDLTLTSEILGTPRYCAPEQLRGEPPTVKSDLYAWGLTLLECLTGTPAIHGSTLAEVYHQHLSAGDVPLPPGLLHHPLGALLRGVLRKDPRARGPSAAELYERAKEINWSALVGSINGLDRGHGMVASATQLEPTQLAGATVERRQITMLGFCLETASLRPLDTATEAQEELLRDQVDRCHDTCLAYGGYPAGTLGTMRLMYFGYPEANEGAARCAARAALELLAQVTQHAQWFEKLSGARLELRLALHTAVVVARSGQAPMGAAATALARLALQSEPGCISVSDGARRLLDRHYVLREALDAQTGRAQFFLTAEQEDVDLDGLLASDQGYGLVGREHELRVLHDLWSRVKAGTAAGAGVLLVGEPGIGKSRLVTELCEHARQENGNAWVLHCMPEHRNSALYPFLRWLRASLQLTGDFESTASVLERLQTLVAGSDMSVAEVVPILGSWLGLRLPEDLAPLPHAPARQKKIVIDSLIQLLLKLARGPLLLVLEDVHWIDPTSRELLDRLLAGDGGNALGLLVTSRPDADYQPSIDILELAGLSESAAKELIQRASQGVSLTRTELAQFVMRADGNPLYLTELVRSQGQLHERRSGQQAGAVNDEVPASLRDVLAQALDRLGPAKETAQLAAAIGREFEYALVEETSLRERTALQTDLEQLTLAGLIQRRRSVHGDSYSFRHALIRDAAYDSLTRELRQLAHARVVRVLRLRAQARPAELAHHYAGAGMYDQAVACMVDAAHAAQERSLHEETRALCIQALAWNRQRTDSTLERMQAELATNRILLPALTALRGLGNAELLELSERNSALIEIMSKQRPTESQAVQTEQSWRNECLEFQAVHFSADCAKTIKMGEDLLSRMRANGERQPQLQVLPLLAQAYHWAGELMTARDRFLCALDIYRPDEDRELWIEYAMEPRCQSLFLLSHTLAYMGEVDAAKRCIEDCLSWARELKCATAADGGVFFGALTDYLCDDRQAINATAAAHEASHANAPEDQWLVAGWRMVYDWANERTEHTQRFVEGSLAAGYCGAICWFEAMLAETEFSQGDVGQGIQRLRQSIARCERMGEVATLPIQYATLASGLNQANGAMDAQAEQHFQTALALSQQHASYWLALRTALAYASELEQQQRLDEAYQVLAPAVNRITEGHGTPLFQRASARLQSICDTTARPCQ